jgi:hypothetical protein
VISRIDTCPTRQVSGAGKLGHVDADLSHQAPSRRAIDSGSRYPASRRRSVLVPAKDLFQTLLEHRDLLDQEPPMVSTSAAGESDGDPAPCLPVPDEAVESGLEDDEPEKMIVPGHKNVSAILSELTQGKAVSIAAVIKSEHKRFSGS